jgi:branched-chain amino acid transport system substrate-binding protein
MLVAVLALLGGAAGAAPRPILIGAVYPTTGRQAPGGLEEFQGVSLAAEFVNQRGGVGGRPVQLELSPADSAQAAPRAVERLARARVPVVVGSYGSTISAPAADTASRFGMVFWETGAVGQLGMRATVSDRVFRYAPTGAVLGRAAVVFVRERLTPRLRRAHLPRYTVVYVNDAYGRAVGGGALAEIAASGLPLAAALPYDVSRVDYDALAKQIAGARTDALVVASYLQDGVALQWALLHNRVPLFVNIGTSSSHCMPIFGEILGDHAVGLFASDKPDADTLRPDRLAPLAADALRWARDEYRRRYGSAMGSAGLSGFAGGLALLGHVLPAAHAVTNDLSPERIARAAREVRVPAAGLPDGDGLAFAPPGQPDAGANLRAASVIWKWVRPKTRAIVWPPTFATHPIEFP